MSLYGVLFWNLGSKNTARFYVTWRKCVRQLMNLPFRTHSRFLLVLCEDIPIDYQLFKRVNKIIWNLRRSVNPCLNMCVKLIEKGSMSNFSKSLCYVSKSLKLQRSSLGMPPGSFNNFLNSKIKNLYTESDFVTMANIKDLLHMHDVGNNIFSCI